MIRLASITFLICGEALAFYVFAEWIAAGYSGDHAHAIGAWAFILLALIAFAGPDFLHGLGVSDKAARNVMVAVALVLFYAVLRIEYMNDFRLWDLGWVRNYLEDPTASSRDGSHSIVGVVLLLALWVRISIKAGDEIDLENVARQAALPFGVVTMVIIFGAWSERGPEIARGGLFFYSFEVLALACAQLALSGATIGEVRAGGVISMLLAGTAGVVVVSLVVLTIFFAFIGPIIGPPLGSALSSVLTIVLTPFAWALEKFFHAFLGNSDPFANIDPSILQNEQPKQAAQQAEHHSPWYQSAIYLLRALALLILLALIGAGVWLVTALRRRSRELRPADTATSRAGGLGDDLGSLLRSVFHRRESRPERRNSGVSRLYLEVLDRAERDARARLAGETAHEFAPVLTDTFHTALTDEITHAFVEARYAGREPDERTLKDLERRWNTVR
jgi:hypothetical protein